MVAEPVIKDWLPHFERQNQQAGRQTEQKLGEREESKRWLLGLGPEPLDALWSPLLLAEPGKTGGAEYLRRDINSLLFRINFYKCSTGSNNMHIKQPILSDCPPRSLYTNLSLPNIV